MSYSMVFGGQNIYPANLTRLELALTAPVTLQWPTEQAIAGAQVFADIIDVTPTGVFGITMPNATLASPGQATLVNNLGGFNVNLLDAGGNTIGVVPSGQVWQLYLASNTTANGVWRTFQFGTGVSTATAAALAGAGLVAISTLLNVRILPETVGGTPYTVLDSDRAKVKLWTGGIGTFNLPDPSVVGTSWFMYVKNTGSGDLTLSTAVGYIDTPTITTKTLGVGESLIAVSDGTNWITLLQGAGVAGDFDFISVNVAGTGDYTLSVGEMNRVSYRFTGALVGNRNIIVPNNIQQYWVSNQTSGAFTLTVKTALGTGVLVPQGYAAILSCDGFNVVAWEGTPAGAILPPQMGGTGQNVYAVGDLLYASATTVLSRLTASAVASRYLSNQGAGNTPIWDQVNLANGVSGQLPHANIANLTGTSVFGRASSSAGVGGSISGTNNQVLRVNNAGTLLEFGQVNLASVAAVTGTLPEGNGGTNQNTYAQGDMLYASAANTLAKLAKHTTFKRPLMNTGTSNNPVWGPLEIFVQTPLAASYTLDIDDAWVLQYESSGTTDVEIPTNASVAYPIGTIIPFVNGAGAGNMTIIPLSGVTLNVQGQALVDPDTFVLPPGYNAVLWKVDTDVWSLLTDAPASAGQGVVYAGYGDGTGAGVTMTFNTAASGWSAARTAQGRYTVTHNLGLTAATDLAVVATARIGAGGSDDRYANVTNETVNAFEIDITDGGAGLVDDDFYFQATRLV